MPAREPPGHPIANAILAVPRTIFVLALTGPRYAAAGIDDYLESRSPNAFGRDTHSVWRFGARLGWETSLGPSIALRAGRSFAPHAALDVYGGLFGPRGQSGGLIATFGKHTAAELEPIVTVDAGRDMNRAFKGIGGEGPRATYNAREVAASASLAIHAGPFALVPRATVDSTRASDGGGAPVSEVYPMLRSYDVREHALAGEVALVLDTRRTTHRWLPEAEPSMGQYARAAIGYLRGEAVGRDNFGTGTLSVEAKQLVDLFHGDRVLTIGVWLSSLTTSDVPFDRLVALGGPDRMRAFARDELRDRTAGYADLEYAWALGNDSRGFLFVETGEVTSSIEELAARRLRVGYGGGIRVVSHSATQLRAQVAASDDGDVGFYVVLGSL